MSPAPARTRAAADLAATARDRLLAGRNRDGGWPYYAGRSSRLEPTCWALLALGPGAVSADDVLARWPVQDGFFLEASGGTVNIAFHALALVACSAGSPAGAGPRVQQGLDALVAERGLTVANTRLLRQNNQIAAWPWTRGTFSWVEPTAWSVLALRRAAPGSAAAQQRVATGVDLLLDRACPWGGWNYGNPHVREYDLRPFIGPTAAAVLALQHVPAAARVVDRAVAWMARDAVARPSVLGLAMAAIALTVHGRPTDVLTDALAEQFTRSDFGNLVSTAFAALALGAREGLGALSVAA